MTKVNFTHRKAYLPSLLPVVSTLSCCFYSILLFIVLLQTIQRRKTTKTAPRAFEQREKTPKNMRGKWKIPRLVKTMVTWSGPLIEHFKSESQRSEMIIQVVRMGRNNVGYKYPDFPINIFLTLHCTDFHLLHNFLFYNKGCIVN